tara:strand:+ start:502 stop:672 length:171 start_codon:yes stop_codon:yes gene_type:complete
MISKIVAQLAERQANLRKGAVVKAAPFFILEIGCEATLYFSLDTDQSIALLRGLQQ